LIDSSGAECADKWYGSADETERWEVARISAWRRQEHGAALASPYFADTSRGVVSLPRCQGEAEVEVQRHKAEVLVACFRYLWPATA